MDMPVHKTISSWPLWGCANLSISSSKPLVLCCSNLENYLLQSIKYYEQNIPYLTFRNTVNITLRLQSKSPLGENTWRACIKLMKAGTN